MLTLCVLIRHYYDNCIIVCLFNFRALQMEAEDYSEEAALNSLKQARLEQDILHLEQDIQYVKNMDPTEKEQLQFALKK